MTDIKLSLSKLISPDIVQNMTYLEPSRHVVDSVSSFTRYTNVMDKCDENIFRAHGMRHEVLVLHPSSSKSRISRTNGIYLPLKDAKYPYTQVFQVIEGESIFLLQTQPYQAEIDCKFISADPGDIVYIPPGYGYTIFNRGDKDLVISSLVKNEVYYDVRTMQSMDGPVYEFSREESKLTFRVNDSYANSTVTTEYDIRDLDVPDTFITGSIYEGFINYPETFNFLK
ncbi:glucose-6-phosphate isomerase [Bacillus phage SP-15]|uniref:glucose-6-phosphate isomerase n=1 Tax=Bacillus phage SP-15 TaxID=1792032 RepID=A0A127AVW8_9CAUD|nr:glucose-6-phosphate isomerase [Bacillus phage SP-15]AMM44810.1 glucose-6-phosphate isomerase [Bacillus phage SP-15]